MCADLRKVVVLICQILFLIVNRIPNAVSSADSYYTAGIVEFRPTFVDLTLREDLDEQLAGYMQLINSPEAQKTDIIVFPECTLNYKTNTTKVPNPLIELIAPCDVLDDGQYATFLKRLSCAVRKANKYVVINLMELEECLPPHQDPRPCSDSGFNLFNTNVVFDRQGYVISRYRKYNLYMEIANETYAPDYGYFDTDFGVRFGHFVCYDILFYTPTQELVEKYGITDFVYPAMWMSQLPFLTAPQIQSGWSYANDVNLLAACSSYPLLAATGSGVYNGRQGALLTVMNKRLGQRKLHIVQVPKKPRRDPQRRKRTIDEKKFRHLSPSDIAFKRDEMEVYTSELVDLNAKTHLQKRLCHQNDFCCDFNLRWHRLPHTDPENIFYTYRLGVYSGWRGEPIARTNRIKNCAIFACRGDHISDCGKLFAEHTTKVSPLVAFDRIELSADFPITTEYLLMPNSLKEDLTPLGVQDFEWIEHKDGSFHHVNFILNSTTDNLMTFSIYGNYFDRIWPANTTSPTRALATAASCHIFACYGMILIILLANFII